MTGHLKRQGNNSWSIVLYLGRDSTTGKKRQRWHTFRGNKKGAQAEMTRLIHELNTGTYIEPTRLTVREYLAQWLHDYAKVNVGPKTFERYRSIVQDHLVPALGGLPLLKLQPLHIQRCYSRWLQSGRKDGRPGGLSAQSVLHHHRVLSQALKQAVRWQLVPRNVAEAVEPPRPAPVEIRPIEESEAVWLIEAAAGTRLRIPILLAVATGRRRGEILAARWRDTDLDLGTISVRRSLIEISDGLIFKEPKSRRGRRPISLPTIAVEMLHAHRKAQATYKAELGADYEDNDLICCREDGTVWPPSAFTSAYRDLLKRRHLDNIRFHNLRHSHASQLLRAGVSPKVISERLGHAKIGFTLERYVHLMPGMQEEASEKIDRTLRSALETQRRLVG